MFNIVSVDDKLPSVHTPQFLAKVERITYVALGNLLLKIEDACCAYLIYLRDPKKACGTLKTTFQTIYKESMHSYLVK